MKAPLELKDSTSVDFLNQNQSLAKSQRALPQAGTYSAAAAMVNTDN
jgi:hypothetical protein